MPVEIIGLPPLIDLSRLINWWWSRNGKNNGDEAPFENNAFFKKKRHFFIEPSKWYSHFFLAVKSAPILQIFNTTLHDWPMAEEEVEANRERDRSPACTALKTETVRQNSIDCPPLRRLFAIPEMNPLIKEWCRKFNAKCYTLGISGQNEYIVQKKPAPAIVIDSKEYEIQKLVLIGGVAKHDKLLLVILKYRRAFNNNVEYLVIPEQDNLLYQNIKEKINDYFWGEGASAPKDISAVKIKEAL